MDVGQIIGTTREQPQRESEPRKEESDDFATFLTEPSPKQEAPAKKEAVQPEPAAEEPAAEEPAAKNPAADQPAITASRDSTAESAAPVAEQKVQATNAQPSPIVTATPATAASNAASASNAVLPQVTPKTANAQTAQTAEPATNEASIDGTAITSVKPEPAKAVAITALGGGNTAKPTAAPVEVVVQAPAPAPAKTAKPAKSNPAASANNTEKTVAIGTENTKPTPVVSEAFTALRTESSAKMSEKDILSTKIAEMLQDGKGKISLNTPSQQQSFQSALASSTNLVTASMAGNPAATALNTLSGAVAHDVDGVIPQVTPAVTANAGGLPVEAAGPTMPTASTGAVQGVEATATNTASQTANAARAAAQLPVPEQVSTQISAAIKEGYDRIKISLHPSELGRVEVKLDIGHDGRILAVVAVDKQETLDMLQRDARSLEKALQDAGFDTGSNSLNFGLRQDSQGEGGNFADLDLPLGDMSDEGDLSMLPQQAPTSGSAGDGSLDIQV